VIFKEVTSPRPFNSQRLANAPKIPRRDRIAGWSEPIRFYPNGTGTDAEFEIVGDSNFPFRIHVRGLTGAVRGGFNGS